MQANPTVERSKIIRWSESPLNQSGRKGKGLWRKGFAEEPSHSSSSSLGGGSGSGSSDNTSSGGGGDGGVGVGGRSSSSSSSSSSNYTVS